ncbi:MAG: tyrosine-type recombinase/integrase [Eubacteriales bacterium]|nr:tyrosine-type recombinase/integrase [Eubacteriales bacterium]
MSRTMLPSRSAAGSGSIRKVTSTKNGKPYTYWQARYTVGYDPGSGKQIQHSVAGKTQREVRQKLNQMTYELDQGTYVAPNKMSLREWMDIWLRDYLNGVKPSTVFLYKQDVEKYILPRLGAVKLEVLDSVMIQRFYNELLHPNRTNVKPLAPKSVKCIHGVFHRALKKAVEVGYMRSNPTEACELPRLVKPEIKPLEEEQVALFLKEIKGHTHEYLYKVALFTGLRESEIHGLTWDCINFNTGTILVKQQLVKGREKGGQYHMTTPKNGKTRTITAAPTVMELLKAQKAKQVLMRIDAGQKWQETNLVFTNAEGGILSYRTTYDCFKRVATRLGFPDARFHDLRHTYAVASIKAGDDIKTVQENLGHATAAFTLDVYGHVTQQMKRDSANRMEAFISSVLC